MNVFEFNKIAGALLMALLVTMVIGVVSGILVSPRKLDKPVYVVAGVEARPEAQSAAVPTAVEPIGPLLASANAEAGRAAFRQCASCHTPDKGGRNTVGPNLYDVVGARRARAEGFAYSPAMQAFRQKDGEDGQWGYEQLNQFLANPRGSVAGTKMAFAGLRRAEERANIVAYLRSLSDSPKPLP